MRKSTFLNMKIKGDEIMDDFMDKRNVDPVIAAQAKALEEQCEAKGYAVIIALANEDEKASSFQSYGPLKPLLDCVIATVLGVYDSMGDEEGLKNLYHRLLQKLAKYLPDLARIAHDNALAGKKKA